jgi:hypothetical protein
MLAEPAVALTDWGLSVEAAVLAVFIRAAGTGRIRTWWVAFFAATAVSALLGGLAHGFFTDATKTGIVLWRLTLLMIGLIALASWGVGASALATPVAVKWIVRGATGLFVAYAVIVLVVTDAFAVAIAHYVPASLFLLVALVHLYRRTAAFPVLAGVVGLVVLFLGTWIQWQRISLHPVYFTHNALYHAIAAVALLGLYQAARWMVASARTR